MDEPLLCWIFLLFAIVWGTCTRSESVQNAMDKRLGCITPLVQWYNVTFFMLLMLFGRTFWDIFRFEFMHDKMLNWDVYKSALDTNVTGIPLSPTEQDFHTGPLVIPTWIRWLSLGSPIAGMVAFIYSAYQVIRAWYSTATRRWRKQPVPGLPDRAPSEPEASTTTGRGEAFLHMVVLGMPLVYIVMALRATIRQWAVMTGSCWLPYSHMEMEYDDRLHLWKELKAEEISTYSQDLEVASGFQFFAVWCFGQVCSKALENVFNEGNAREMGSDETILLQLGVFGIHTFVVLGVVKTIFNMLVAIASAKVAWEAAIEPVQQAFLQFIDPIFMFATILSVINMLLLGKMKRVSKNLPNLNTKFNATRALLLIGQGQLTILRAATTDIDGAKVTSKVLKLLHQVPFGPFHKINWWLTMNQARLVHSSLLCYECLFVVIMNAYTWERAEAREGEEAGRQSMVAPLLGA